MIESLERIHTEYQLYWRKIHFPRFGLGQAEEFSETFTDENEFKTRISEVVGEQEILDKAQDPPWRIRDIIANEREVFASPWKSRRV